MTPNQDEWRHIYSVTARITIQYHSVQCFSTIHTFVMNKRISSPVPFLVFENGEDTDDDDDDDHCEIEWQRVVRDSIFDKMFYSSFFTFTTRSLSSAHPSHLISLVCRTCIIWNGFQVYNEMSTHGTQAMDTKQNKTDGKPNNTIAIYAMCHRILKSKDGAHVMLFYGDTNERRICVCVCVWVIVWMVRCQ